MLNIPTHTRIYLCTEPTDMRKSFDGLHVYQKAIDFADSICGLTERFPRGYGFGFDYEHEHEHEQEQEQEPEHCHCATKHEDARSACYEPPNANGKNIP